MGIDQIDADYYTCVVTSINAGVDMVMVPFEFRRFIDTLAMALERGDVSIARIDDAVRRILTVKAELGLFEQPFGDEELLRQIGSRNHRAVAREAVGKSLVLLKNEHEALPLDRTTPMILVAGRGADDIGIQCGGWTIDWMGNTGAMTTGTTLLDALRGTVALSDIRYAVDGRFDLANRAEIGVVVLSELPYAEGEGDRADLNLAPADHEVVQRMRDQVEKLIVILYSGRPLILGGVLDACDALIAAWLPGTEGHGLTDTLFGDVPFTGKLPHAWPRSMDQIPRRDSADYLLRCGYGLTI
jgi:beta-glucosidase